MSSQDKKGQRVKNSRRWTDEEKALSAEVLADTDNNFLVAIEKLALSVLSMKKYLVILKTYMKSPFKMNGLLNSLRKRTLPTKRGTLNNMRN